MFENATKNGTLEIRGTKFQYEIYYSPIQHQESIKEDIINRYGSRLHNGQICLGITKDIVRETMNANDYNVIVFVKNAKEEDEASGALQYWDWCNSGEKQLWIGDLCRSTTLDPKPVVSPVEALLEIFTLISKSKNMQKINLMVQDTKGDNVSILTKIYKKYGFTDSQQCKIDGFLVMEKFLGKNGGRRSTKKSKKRKLRTIKRTRKN